MKYVWKWSGQAKAGLRALNKETALRVLRALDHYAQTGHGDVRVLHGPLEGCLRLRVGDWRVRFREAAPGTFEVAAIDH